MHMHIHWLPRAEHLAQASTSPCVAPPADQMVWEVSRALTWTLDSVHLYGGDPSRISAVGHSAGGHLISMALLSRCGTGTGTSTRHAGDLLVR